jgi:hypothetical protein
VTDLFRPVSVPVAILVLGLGLATPTEAIAEAPRSVGLVIDTADAPAVGPKLRAAVHRVLDHDARLAIRPLDIESTEGSSLAEADAWLAKALQLFRAADLESAKLSLADAQRSYETQLVELVQRDGSARALRDVHLLAAKVNFFSGDFDGAKEALRRVFALDPKLTFSSAQLPPQMKRAVTEARLLFDAQGFARLDVASGPPGATLYVNGVRAPGVTPTGLEVACGPNVVELRAAGYGPGRQTVDLGKDSKISLRLLRSEDRQARAHAATAAIAANVQPNGIDLDTVAKALDVEALVLIHVASLSETQFRLSGELYRRAQRTGRARTPAKLEPRVEREDSLPQLEEQADSLTRVLTEPLFEHDFVATEAPAESGATGFRHSKAFWWVIGGVVGAVVVGAAVGTGVGIYESRRQDLARQTVLLGGR